MTGTYFIVTCCGFSGSKWLAAAIDKHPDIVCTHSASDLRIWDRAYNAEELDACAKEEWSLRHNKPLDDYLAGLENHGEATVHGNVHRYRIVDLARLCEKWSPEKNFQLANLVRHPVNWAESGGHHFAHLAETSIFNRYELLQACMHELDFYQSLARRHDLDLRDWDVLVFLSACQYMSVLAKDTHIVAGVRHVPMERLTADRALYREVLEGLTSKRVEVGESYLDEVFGLGRVNRHRDDGGGEEVASESVDADDAGSNQDTPDRLYAAWPDWKREGFEKFLAKYQLRSAYEPLGYSFSFCNERAAA